jgi:hypothetical protein
MMTIFVVAMAFGRLAALDQKHKPIAEQDSRHFRLD